MKVLDLLKENDDKTIIACRYQNEIKPLNIEIGENEEVEFIDTTSREGRKIYHRGLLYIMSKALIELWPKVYISVNFQLYNSMYCTLENMEVTNEMLEKARKKMQEIIDADLEIKKVDMSKEDAIKFYEKEQNLRGRLQVDNKYKGDISLYYCEDYYDYFYGVMPISTGYIKLFELVKYQEGFLLRYPPLENPNQIKPYKETKKLMSSLKDYNEIYKLIGTNTIYKLNKKIQEGKEKEVIMLAEALHEKKISDIADSVAKHDKIKMILIAGPSSSGKTTFAKRLGIQLQLNGLKPLTISVDNYFVEREDTPLDENGNYNFEDIEAIDLKLFNEHLSKLLNGEEIEAPSFDFKTGHKEFNGNKMKMNEDEVLVIEGIHCLNDRLTESIAKEQKYKIYISALTVLNIDYHNRISTTDNRLVRRIVRDNNFRGYSALETLRNWSAVNIGEEKNIYKFQEQADIMFNSSLIYELCVLKKYAMPLLAAIDNTHIEYSEAKNLYEFIKYFEDIGGEYVPRNSLLREFIGGSVFEV